MVIFAIERIGELKGAIPFYKLFYKEKCQINDYENELKKSSTYYSEVKTIKLYMDAYSNGQRLPDSKYKILKQNETPCTCFEFRSKNLRYYGFVFPGTNNMIICMAAKNDKSKQQRDINHLIKIQKEYCDSLPNKLKKISDGKK